MKSSTNFVIQYHLNVCSPCLVTFVGHLYMYASQNSPQTYPWAELCLPQSLIPLLHHSSTSSIYACCLLRIFESPPVTIAGSACVPAPGRSVFDTPGGGTSLSPAEDPSAGVPVGGKSSIVLVLPERGPDLLFLIFFGGSSHAQNGLNDSTWEWVRMRGGEGSAH